MMWPQQIANRCRTLSYSLALVHLIPSWLFLADIECTVLVKYALKEKASLDQLSKADNILILRAYCPNIRTECGL